MRSQAPHDVLRRRRGAAASAAPPRIWQCPTGAMAIVTGRNPPPDVSQAVAATCWQIRFRMQTSLWHTSDAHINHIRRDMLANTNPHANFALAPEGGAHINPHSPQYAGKYDFTCKLRSGTGRGAHINQHSPQYAGKYDFTRRSCFGTQAADRHDRLFTHHRLINMWRACPQSSAMATFGLKPQINVVHDRRV